MNIELSEQAFHLAWQHFRLGTKPLSLNVLPEGLNESERRDVEQRSWEELRLIGFGDRDAEDAVSGVFFPLDRYRDSFDLVYRYLSEEGEHRRTALAANGPASSALAVREGGVVRLRQLRTDDAPHRAVVGVLPELNPGPGKAVSVPSDQLDAAAADAGDSDRAMREALLRRGVRRDDASALVEMAGGERVGYAQFGAARMDQRGHRSRAPMVTNCFATTKGWYLMEETIRSGRAWTTFAPIDRNRLAERVRDLARSIVPE
ncbi:ESX secretion-associated protein EspG [Actinopolyspora sp. H202]|uniref:ESX secretion-associated protein EspG n=1 Tax=Actinopolyspora sp. H202 TaxID=1500456 RepID=UPI003EE7F0B8